MKYIKKSAERKFLVITPLRKGDVVSDITLDTIQRNSLPFEWIEYQGTGNPYKNTHSALLTYSREKKVPEYVIKIDNDIEAEDGMLDKMYDILVNAKPNVAYTYCSFEFKGAVNAKFPAAPFNSTKLCMSNSISSMSMLKLDALNNIKGFVTDDKYFRLLDWALWLKFLEFGYVGQPTMNTSFIAHSGPNSVSARSNEDYKEKFNRIQQDFVKPILERINQSR